MNSGQYDLSVNYSGYLSEQGENNKESLFEATGNSFSLLLLRAMEFNMPYSGSKRLRWYGTTAGDGMCRAMYWKQLMNLADRARRVLFLFNYRNCKELFNVWGRNACISFSGSESRYNHKVLGEPSLRNTISRVVGGWMYDYWDMPT